MKNENANKIISLVLKVIPVAMAAAAAVLSILGQITAETGVLMLAIGMFSGGLERLRQQ